MYLDVSSVPVRIMDENHRLSLVPGQLVYEESYRYDSNGLRFLPGDGIKVNLELYIV